MPRLESSEFQMRLGSVPLFNLRLDFNAILALFRKEQFRAQFLGHRGEPVPIKTHYFTWHGRPEVLLTYVLRDAIVGLESGVSGAVLAESLSRGNLSDKVMEAVKNPFSLAGRGTADLVFNVLPCLVGADYALERRSPDLWARVRIFYREVRNPIFHAYEISDADPVPVWKALEFIWELFGWLNSWHNIQSIAGPIELTDPKVLTTIPEVSNLRMRQIVPERRIDPNPERDAHLPDGLEQAPDIEDVVGMGIPSDDKVCLTMRTNGGRDLNMELSAHAAMKLLAWLARAHQDRGWAIPDR